MNHRELKEIARCLQDEFDAAYMTCLSHVREVIKMPFPPESEEERARRLQVLAQYKADKETWGDDVGPRPLGYLQQKIFEECSRRMDIQGFERWPDDPTD